MKKTISLLIAFVLLFSVISIPSGASDTQARAFLRIDNILEFTWSCEDADTVDIYGTENPGAEDKVNIVTDLNATLGAYKYDFLSKGERTYNEYYVFEFKRDNILSKRKIVKTEFVIKRRDKKIRNIEHPFIAADTESVARVKELIQTDESYKRTYDKLIEDCDNRVKDYVEPDQIDSSSISTGSFPINIYYLGIAYALSGEEKYLVAGRNGLMYVLNYIQEKPSIAVEIKNDYWYIEEALLGYDLLYNGLNEVDRQIIENGLLRPWAERLAAVGRGRSANQGGVNHVVQTIGLLLKDQELIDLGLNREGYGLRFNWLNAINDDGTMWNQPPMYMVGSAQYYYRLAESYWNSGYDMFDETISGERTTEFLGYDANFREAEYGDNVTVENMNPMKTRMSFFFNYIYPDRTYPRFGDTDSVIAYNLKYNSGMSKEIYEIVNSRMDDPRASWIISEAQGNNRERGIIPYRSLFLADTLKETENFKIGNEYFAEKGYNKLGSTMFNDYGLAFLRSPGKAEDSTTATLFWKRYQEPHGHSDMLNMTLYGAGALNIRDMGSFTYGSKVQANYTTKTVGHNTVVIDETEHWPAAGSYTTEQLFEGESSRGFLENAAIGPKSRVVKGWSDRMYSQGRNGIDSTLSRTLWQIDDYAIDIFRATNDGKTHSFDYLLNINGELTSSSRELKQEADETISLGNKNEGYTYIQKLKKSGVSNEMWHNEYSIKDGGKLRISMLGGDDMEVISAKAANRDYEFVDEKLVVRKTSAEDTTFISVMQPKRENEAFRTVTEIPVKLRGKVIDWSNAVKISDNTGTDDIFIYGETYGVKEAGDLQSDGESAFLRTINGEDAVLGGLGARVVSGRNISLSFKSQSSMQFTKMCDGCYRLDMGDGEQRETGVRISGLGEGYTVYKTELSENNNLVKYSDSLSFNVERGVIYIIAKGDSYAKMDENICLDFSNTKESAGELTNSVKVKVLEKAPDGIIIEAEDFFEEEGGKVILADYDTDSHSKMTDASAFYGWDYNGHTLKWKINLPAAGKYHLMYSYSTLGDGGADRTLQINDSVAYSMHFNMTNSWRDRKFGLLQNDDGSDILFDFKEGENIITMVNIGNGLNLDYIKIIPAE